VFLFFFVVGTKFQNFSLAPSSLRRLERVLFLFLFLFLLRRRRRLVLSRYYSPRGVLSQIADFDKNVVLRIKKYTTGDAKDGHDGRKAANEKSVDAFEEIHPFFGWEVAHPEYE
jgi:hypothetical protein